MKLLIHLITAVALLAAIYLIFQAVTIPGKYMLSAASAIQVSQVYAESGHYALLAICALLFGILLELSMLVSALDKDGD